MGEVTEMILEGILCQVCGEYIGEGEGYPVTCRGCGGSGGSDLSDFDYLGDLEADDARP